ncbi:MAG TPA: double zinc ribbon domain-containing protein [Planctomicrobium sp.]|nr:double zinc ribbon domain-containing protein [Planctomicrobium sp.]
MDVFPPLSLQRSAEVEQNEGIRLQSFAMTSSGTFPNSSGDPVAGIGNRSGGGSGYRLIPKWLTDQFQGGLDFIFPPACRWCDKIVGSDRRGAMLCDACQTAIAPRLENRCLRCSAPAGPYQKTDHGCPHCRPHPRLFEETVSLGQFHGELERLCYRCKRARSRPLAAACAQLLFEREQERLRSWNIDLIVPVPHFWIDRVWQENTVSNTLAEELSRFLMVSTDRHILFKLKWTQKQQGKTATVRRQNLKDAFRVHPKARLSGLRLLVTDDVLTSGTTANRVASVLLEAGAKSVSVAVLARTILK